MLRRLLIRGGRNNVRNYMKQTSDPLDILPASAVGEEPVIADTVEPSGQDMREEAAHELFGIERHGLAAGQTLGAVILPAEGDRAAVHRDEAAVGDGDPVRVA